MEKGVPTAIWLLTGVAALLPARALGQIDLELRPEEPSVPVGLPVNVRLYAVAETNTPFTSLDVVLTWDEEALELIRVRESDQHDWNFAFGFLPDGGADGLNNSLADGDALFQALSFSDATALPIGLLVATLEFTALKDVAMARINIEAALGQYSETAVWQGGAINITGDLFGVGIPVSSEARLWALDVTVPSARIVDIPVWGEIDEKPTYGVVLQVELIPLDDAVGAVSFTPAPPSDIEQIGDPWPGAGQFTTYDTNVSGSAQLNGSVDDDGTFIPADVHYLGPLTAFPVSIGAGTSGSWKIRMCTGRCAAVDGASKWEAGDPLLVPTGLGHALLRVVSPGDGDASGAIDLRDASQLQACFTGTVGPADPPAYPVAGPRPCAVYDYDNDGDVDTLDWIDFSEALIASE